MPDALPGTGGPRNLGDYGNTTSPMADLSAVVAEIRRRSPRPVVPEVNPLEAIFARCRQLPPSNSERMTLELLALAIIQGEPREVSMDDVNALPPEALSLLDALIKRRPT